MAPIIAYWNIRAFVEPIILTMKQAKAPFELRTYKLGDAPDFDRSDWLQDKYNLGLIYPNIPYYIDDDVKLTQTLAILRYLGRKHDLGPKSEEETIRSDIVEQGAIDIMHSLLRCWYTVNGNDEVFQANITMLLPVLEEKLNDTSAVLGLHKFILGDRVTYVDFLLYSTLDYMLLFKPSLFDKHATLTSYLDRIETLPDIEPYFKSETFNRFPIITDYAKWGNRIHNKPM